ncbi:hypothetical protein J40TS1_34440 [Paenibacillus montaniterrae]|uniref:Uncharacterized protein n=1 Tax=Paenibacillus montaniterrae TaxID=429341 RepID=A0A919YR88_9BACL|nr:hypothetical protein [Paenibacillus montaniterrae]GIP17802.1 hypothetical protein J40TS1_34440 [Paenibacillus montaniterrae]
MIRATVKTIPHPNPKNLVDVWANIVLKEIEKQKEEERSSTEKQVI